jgi:signal transduction histidine kinase
MFDTEFLLYLACILGGGMSVFIVMWSWKFEKLNQVRARAKELKRSLDEMDEQAKLIVRTDMELNKTQEELDKKITALYALHGLSRAVSTTLEERQIFNMVDSAYLQDLGFQKTCAFLWQTKEERFVLKTQIEYFPDEIEKIKKAIELDKTLYLELIKRNKGISSIYRKENTAAIEKIKNAFGCQAFIISCILPKEGDKGFLFVGSEEADVAITEGDEELITILANQIGQALENARLFEKTWLAHQDLEKKVKERTRELTAALEEVKMASKRKTDFVSSVSHELRTPLTSIKGYASILLAEKLGQLPPEAKERLEKINRHSDELTHMINDLLDISHIESGKVIMKRQSHELKSIIEKILDLFSLQLKEKQINVQLNMADLPQNIFVDPSQIERVFINLVGNAIKFTPQQGEITITTKNLNDQVQVDIADSGCGIPEEAQGHIFEEFYRVDNSINEQVKGSGLGLSLVKHIVQAHGGKIWFKSKENQGTTFSFTLPRPSHEL